MVAITTPPPPLGGGTTPPFDPKTTSSAYNRMRDRLKLLRDVYGGTETLRAGGATYMPRFEREEIDDWRARLDQAVLVRNMFRQAVDRLTGRIFEVPITLDEAPEGSPGAVMADDADRRGNSLDRVGRQLFMEALKCGLMHVLVEYPVVPPGATLAQERALKPRPYLALLAPEAVLACYEDKDTGEVTYLRWWDISVEWDETQNAEVAVERVHERWPGRYRTWKLPQATQSINSRATPRPAPSQWVVEAEGTVTLPGGRAAKVMFHTLYAEREHHMVGRTPLVEVADLTVSHWQLYSDYKTCLQHILFPILYATGVDQKDIAGGNLVLGPRSVLGSDKAEAKFGYVEHNGKSVEAGKAELEALEQRAESYAGRLTKPSGDVKATTEAISTAETSSFAKDMAISLQDTLQAALDDAALWVGAETMGRVHVSTDFAVDLSEGDLAALQAARSQGDIPLDTYWAELKRRNVLSRDFDEVEAKRLIEDERNEGMEREKEAMRAAAEIEAPRQPGGTSGPPTEEE